MAKRVQVDCWPTQVPLLGLKVQILAKLMHHAGDRIDILDRESPCLHRMIEAFVHHYQSSTVYSVGRVVFGFVPSGWFVTSDSAPRLQDKSGGSLNVGVKPANDSAHCGPHATLTALPELNTIGNCNSETERRKTWRKA
jgi:hypothetical protein